MAKATLRKKINKLLRHQQPKDAILKRQPQWNSNIRKKKGSQFQNRQHLQVLKSSDKAGPCCLRQFSHASSSFFEKYLDSNFTVQLSLPGA